MFHKNLISIILLLGLVNGLIYVFVILPWEHYDEPGHFEYAWLIAHRFKLPNEGDYDQGMRLAVGRSLIESRFFERRGSGVPNLTDPTQPLWIGINQTVDPPLYYGLAAVPLYILQGAPINWQLYSGRILSLFFLLATLYAAYKITSELTPQGHPLRWLVPVFLALLPGFVEFMTAMNDYPAAIGFISLWLLSAVRLIKEKWTIKQAAILLILTLACLFTQKAVYYVIAFVPLVFLFSWLPRGKEWIGWAVSIAAGMIALVVVFNWNDAAFWLRRSDQDFGSLARLSQGSDFNSAVQGRVVPEQFWGGDDPSWHSGFFQLLPIETSRQLEGKQVTLGAWVWSDQTLQGYGPGINSLAEFQDRWFGFDPILLSTKPQFIAAVINVPSKQDRIQVWLRTTSPTQTNARIYFSGIVLAEGAMPVDCAPQLDEEGSQGVWTGQPFKNLVRNGDAIHSWPFLRPEIARPVFEKVSGVTPTTVSSFIALFLDGPGTRWYISGTAERIFRTFWATFSWGQLQLYPLPWIPQPYRMLLVITILGIAGSVIPMIRTFGPYRTEVIFLILSMVTTILVAFLYGVYAMGGALRFRAYLPVARYVFPAIIPIALVLVTGWYGLLKAAAYTLRFSPKLPGAVIILFLVFLNGYSIFSIIKFFSA